MARAAKVEVARVVEGYKKSTNFEDKVSKATCDAYQKGFEECKKKVTKAFHLLDLSEIRADEHEEAEEGEVVGDGGEAIETEGTLKIEVTIMFLEELQSNTAIGVAGQTKLEGVAR